MKRTLLTLGAAVSLLLCLTIVLLWVRSYSRVTFAARYARPREGDPVFANQIELRTGRVLLIHDVWERGGPAKCEYVFHDFPAGEYPDDWGVEPQYLGFGWVSRPMPPDMETSHISALSVPCWPLFTCAALLTAYLMRRRLVSSWIPGRCRTCGYDLRATQSRCPECGTRAIGAPPDDRLPAGGASSASGR